MYFTSKPSEDEPKVNRPVAKAPPPRPVSCRAPGRADHTRRRASGRNRPRRTQSHKAIHLGRGRRRARLPATSAGNEIRSSRSSRKLVQLSGRPAFHPLSRLSGSPIKARSLRRSVSSIAHTADRLGQAHLRYAWQLRGTALDNAVSDESRQQFSKEAAKAQPLLARARELGVKDGEAYALSLQLARIEKNPLAETRAIFNEAARSIRSTFRSMKNWPHTCYRGGTASPATLSGLPPRWPRVNPATTDSTFICTLLTSLINMTAISCIGATSIASCSFRLPKSPSSATRPLPTWFPSPLCTVVAQDRDVANAFARRSNTTMRLVSGNGDLSLRSFCNGAITRIASRPDPVGLGGAAELSSGAVHGRFPLRLVPNRLWSRGCRTLGPTDKKSQLRLSAPASRVQKLAIHPSNTWLAAIAPKASHGWACGTSQSRTTSPSSSPRPKPVGRSRFIRSCPGGSPGPMKNKSNRYRHLDQSRRTDHLHQR